MLEGISEGRDQGREGYRQGSDGVCTEDVPVV